MLSITCLPMPPPPEVGSSFSEIPMILLVEDSIDDAFFFRRALGKSGLNYVLKHALNGEVAAELIHAALAGTARMPEALFVDLKMPVMNGFELLEWIGRQGLTDSFAVTVLSGSNQPEDRDRAEELGASGYLVKPISSREIAARLRDVIH